MIRQLRRFKERQARKAEHQKLGPKSDPDDTAKRYVSKLRTLSLGRLGRELKTTYEEADQMDRVLSAYRMENNGELPLCSSQEAPVALAIGNRYYYIASELHRRGIVPRNDVRLGGDSFTSFFSEVANQIEQSNKETLSKSFLERFNAKVRSLLRKH